MSDNHIELPNVKLVKSQREQIIQATIKDEAQCQYNYQKKRPCISPSEDNFLDPSITQEIKEIQDRIKKLENRIEEINNGSKPTIEEINEVLLQIQLSNLYAVSNDSAKISNVSDHLRNTFNQDLQKTHQIQEQLDSLSAISDVHELLKHRLEMDL